MRTYKYMVNFLILWPYAEPVTQIPFNPERSAIKTYTYSIEVRDEMSCRY